jgi:hypothetical protein
VTEEEITLEQEKLECARSRLARSFGVFGTVAEAGRFQFSTTTAAIVDPAIGTEGGPHRGMEVGQLEDGPSDLVGWPAVRVEGMEPDSGIALVVVDVGPDIQLEEPREPRHRWQARGPDPVHAEGHDPDPRGSIAGVEVEALWQGFSPDLGIGRPVKKEQLRPSLSHRGQLVRRALADGLALLRGG